MAVFILQCQSGVVVTETHKRISCSRDKKKKKKTKILTTGPLQKRFSPQSWFLMRYRNQSNRTSFDFVWRTVTPPINIQDSVWQNIKLFYPIEFCHGHETCFSQWYMRKSDIFILGRSFKSHCVLPHSHWLLVQWLLCQPGTEHEDDNHTWLTLDGYIGYTSKLLGVVCYCNASLILTDTCWAALRLFFYQEVNVNRNWSSLKNPTIFEGL